MKQKVLLHRKLQYDRIPNQCNAIKLTASRKYVHVEKSNTNVSPKQMNSKI